MYIVHTYDYGLIYIITTIDIHIYIYVCIRMYTDSMYTATCYVHGSICIERQQTNKVRDMYVNQPGTCLQPAKDSRGSLLGSRRRGGDCTWFDGGFD